MATSFDQDMFFYIHSGWNKRLTICHSGHIENLTLSQFKKVQGIFSIKELDFSKKDAIVTKL